MVVAIAVVCNMLSPVPLADCETIRQTMSRAECAAYQLSAAEWYRYQNRGWTKLVTFRCEG